MDPRWALRDAERIADHARLRSEYRSIASVSSGNDEATGARRDAAWERERPQRRCEAKRRREGRLLLRAVARMGARGVVARQLAHWSIETIMSRRRTHEYDAGRVRWEATKIVLASERRLGAWRSRSTIDRSLRNERAPAISERSGFWSDSRLRRIKGTSGPPKHRRARNRSTRCVSGYTSFAQRTRPAMSMLASSETSDTRRAAADDRARHRAARKEIEAQTARQPSSRRRNARSSSGSPGSSILESACAERRQEGSAETACWATGPLRKGADGCNARV